jgi:GrpB-like predicted nucleotidyltransferase (UPF0157 family)
MAEPLTDEQLVAVTVGERKRHDAPITLSESDPTWPAQFEQEAEQVRVALGSKALLIEHVGSTSVPGLPAKPILDMLLEVADSSDEAAYLPGLEAHGFVLHIREPDWEQHRMLKSTRRAVNLHVFSTGSPEIQRMLAFRERLRDDAQERELYARTKRELAAKTWTYVQRYADAKSEVVEAILARC